MLPIQYLVYPFIILIVSLQYPQTPQSTPDHDISQLVSWSKEASQFYLQGKYSEALALNDKIIASLDGQWSWDLFYKTLFLSSEIYRTQAKHSEAENILSYARESIENNPEHDIKINADIQYYQGCVTLDKMELEKARHYFLNAIEIYKCIGDDSDTLIAPVLNKLGNLNFYYKDYDSALIYYLRALKLNERKKNNLYDLSTYLQNIGIIYSIEGDYKNAESVFIKSAKIKKQVYGPESLSLAKTYLNLGRFYHSISNFDSALIYFEKASSIIIKSHNTNSPEMANIYWNKGICLGVIGDYPNALKYLNYAKDIYYNNYDTLFPFHKSIIMDIGFIYELSEMPDKAVNNYLQCLDDNDLLLKIKVLRNLGNCYHRLGNNNYSSKYFTTALNIASSNNLSQLEVGITKMNYGKCLIENGNKDGIVLLKEALSIFRFHYGDYNRDISKVYSLIGDYYQVKNDFDKSLKQYHNALLYFNDIFSDTNTLNNPLDSIFPNDILYVEILNKKATVLYEIYRDISRVEYLIAAIENYHISTNVVNNIRNSYHGNDSKFLLAKYSKSNNESAITTCLEAFRITNDSSYLEDAFYFSEKNKSMVLLTEMKEANAWEAGNVAPSIRAYDKELKLEIEASKDFIQREYRKINPDKVKISRMEAKLFKLELKQDSLVGYLERYHPEYNKLKFDLNTARTKEVRKMLRDNEALVMYSMGESGIIIFLLTRREFDYYQVPVCHPIAPVIAKLNANLQIIDAHRYRYEDYLDYQQLAHELYQILVDPMQEKIKGKKLIIVPDEELGFLSFDMLLERKDIYDSIKFTGLPFLIRQYAISYASSATLFVNNRIRPVESLNKGVLAMAPEYGKVERRGILGLGDFGRAENCKSIPWAQKEACDVHRVFGGKILIREKATKEYFLKLSGNYDIVHLALHTRIDKNYPLSSQLSFYPFEDTVSKGALKVYEILNLDFRGQLAVLSACNTGGGKLEKGEGIISIARAFMFAGIPSVVTTLWDVEDHASQKLIHGFYQYLEQGMDKDEALRQSKLDYLGETKTPIETHPAFWAGYILYGESSGIDLNPGKRQLAGLSSLVIPFLILAVSLYCLIRLRKKRVTLS